MDKEKIKDRWTEYCSELYRETEQTNKELLKELQQITPPDEVDGEEDDGILYEEVERAVNHLKRGKSPGTDGITGEMIKAGGQRWYKHCTLSANNCGMKEQYQRNGQNPYW